MNKLIVMLGALGLSLSVHAATQTDTKTDPNATVPINQPLPIQPKITTSPDSSPPPIIKVKPNQPGTPPTNPIHDDAGTATDVGPTNPMAPTAPSNSPGP